MLKITMKIKTAHDNLQDKVEKKLENMRINVKGNKKAGKRAYWTAKILIPILSLSKIVGSKLLDEYLKEGALLSDSALEIRESKDSIIEAILIYCGDSLPEGIKGMIENHNSLVENHNKLSKKVNFLLDKLSKK